MAQTAERTQTDGTARIDRWLWAVRLFTTRPDAAQACKAGHITINGHKAKAATRVVEGDRVEARVQSDWVRVVDVVRPIARRVGAKVAVDCYVDHSPPRPTRDPLALFEGVRDPGAGRPTKRDRREMERLRGNRGPD